MPNLQALRSYHNGSALYGVSLGQYNQVTGSWAVAVGYGNTTSGQNSFAAGIGDISSGTWATAFGSGCIASGSYSYAGGINSTSSATTSITLGMGVNASSFEETVVGAYNTPFSNPNASVWVPTDPVFVVGSGSSATSTSNAMTILKNGTILIHPQGDLMMGAYTSGSQP